MFRLIAICLLFVNIAFAQKVLHVSTIPSKADIYVQEMRPDHTDDPDYTSPAFIPLSDEQVTEGEILVSLFHPEFTDTTIRVKLSDRDTSYLIVSQQPALDEDFLSEQRSELSKRQRKKFGKGLMFTSVLPFAVSAVAGIVTQYEISKAEDSKKTLKNSAIAETKHYRQTERDFKDYRDKAKTSRSVMYTGLIAGASFLTLGFILTF